MRFGSVAAPPGLLVLAVASALAFAQPPSSPPPGSTLPGVLTLAPEIGQYGGALVTAQIAEPRTFNPITAAEASSTNLLAPIFERLVEPNILTGEIEPALAESDRADAGGNGYRGRPAECREPAGKARRDKRESGEAALRRGPRRG